MTEHGGRTRSFLTAHCHHHIVSFAATPSSCSSSPEPPPTYPALFVYLSESVSCVIDYRMSSTNKLDSSCREKRAKQSLAEAYSQHSLTEHDSWLQLNGYIKKKTSLSVFLTHTQTLVQALKCAECCAFPWKINFLLRFLF